MSPRIAAAGLAGALASSGDRAAPPVVLAVGPESYLREEVLSRIAEHVLGDAASPSLIVLQGAATSSDADAETLDRFFDETRTGSLFAPRKVVALQHAGTLLSRHKAAFLAWLADPGRAATAVVLAAQAPKPVETAAAKVGLVVTCGGRGGGRGEPPARFAVRQAALREKRLGGPQAELLVELLGRDLTTVANAVEILALHAGESDEITEADIDALFRSAREGSVWAFGDLLVEGDVVRAMAEAERCFAEGVHDYAGSRRVTRSESGVAVRLLSAFGTAVCRTLSIREQLDRGVARDDIEWPGHVPWPAQKRILAAASRRRTAALQALVVFAEETDKAMKSGGAQGRVAVARLAAAVRNVR